jgi:predicted Zn-dependent protease
VAALGALLLVLAPAPSARAQSDATAVAAIEEARAALQVARATPGFATPDVPVWDAALDAARRAVDAAGDGPHAVDALRVQAAAYQGTSWWSRAFATWAEVERLAGELSEDERDAWRDAGMQLAFARYEAGDLDGAATRFEELAAARPDDPELLRWIGRLALERDRPGEAAEAWARLLELRPDDAGARFHLALAEERSAHGREASDAFRRGLEAHDSGDLAAAAEAFGRAVDLAPDWDEPLRWRARSLLEADRGAEAATAWARLAERRPDDEEVAYFLQRARSQAEVGREALLAADAARAATRAGDAGEALAAWRRASEAAPSWRDARLGVARSALAAGDGPTAERAWTDLLEETDPGDPLREEARQGIATARLLARLGGDAAAAYGSALAAYERGEMALAAERLEEVVSAAPDALEPWTLLGRIAFARSDWATAARAYETAAELAPDDDDLAFFAEEARSLAGPEDATPR